MNRARSKLFWMALFVLAAATRGSGAEQQQGEPRLTEVLSHNTLLRTWMVFRAPVVIGSDGELKQPFTPEMKGGKLIKHEIPEYQSPLPGRAWRAVAFDDSPWRPLRKPRPTKSTDESYGLHWSNAA